MTPTLEAKVADALRFLREEVPRYARPIIFSSFGKDSMVTIDLCQRAGFDLPILFHREPFHPRKYAFANKVIEDNGYVVYDYPPVHTGVTKANGTIEIINWHQVGARRNYLPTGIRAPEPGHPFLCGLHDIYEKPRAAFNFPWDLGILGHKSSDHDPVLGPMPLATNLVVYPNSADFAFPIKEFTDQDIWEYTLARGIPINERRYNRADNWREFADITYNPDYFHACTACIDPEAPEEVYCPKINAPVPHANVNYVAPVPPPYVRR